MNYATPFFFSQSCAACTLLQAAECSLDRRGFGQQLAEKKAKYKKDTCNE
jgi:hypothetical protein